MDVEQLKLWMISRPDGHAWEKPPIRTDYEIDVSAGWHGGADPLIAQGFLDSVLRGIEPVNHPLAGRMSVAVGCEAYHSLRDRSVRSVPGVQEPRTVAMHSRMPRPTLQADIRR
jgi:hypothetical protein